MKTIQLLLIENKSVMAKEKPRLYRMLSVMLVIFLYSNGGFSQTNLSVSGKVLDAESNPLIGATVLEKGTENGTTTDFDGQFTLSVASEASELLVSYIGYTSREIRVDEIENNTITLEQSSELLDEVVVVGYGEQSKLSLTSAVSALESEEFADVPAPSVNSRIQGRLAGVSVNTISGQPGNDLRIRIRGGSSINKSNAPLIIIDGFQRGLNDINPDDIESINILKDAAATSIYGARASNGVVLIETKRGKMGANQLEFKVSYGLQEFNRQYDLLNSREYLQWWRPRVATSRYGLGQQAPQVYTENDENSTWTTRFLQEGESVPQGWETMVDPVTGKTLVFQDNNLQDILFRTGNLANYNLSASGGSNLLKYAASIGYTDQQGVAIGTQYERLNARVNLDFDINDKLKFGINTHASHSNTNRFDNEAHLFTRGAFNAPTIRREFEDGTPGWGTNGALANPAWVIATRDNQAHTTNGDVGVTGEWNIFKDLSLRGNTFFQFKLDTRDYFEKAHFFSELRRAEASRNVRYQRQSELFLNYDKSINQSHNFNFIFGYSDLYIKDNDALLIGNGASSDNIPTLNGAPTKLEARTLRSDERLVSLFSRLNYNFNNKYLFSASVRRDGSSKFGSGNKFGYFPSLSAGWVLSEESFFPNSRVLNYLKLRGSYGLTGNNSIGRYDSQGRYAPGNNYGGNAGVIPVEMPNSALSWEKTTQADIGLDLSLFEDGQIDITLDWYQRLTDDLLFNVQLSRESGYNSIEQNVGSVEYRGLEFSISTLNISNENFRWTSSFNFAYNINEVIKLPFREGVDKNRINGTIFPDGSGYGGIAEGERLNNLVGHKVDYLIDNQEQAENALYDESANGFDPVTGTRIGRGVKFPGDFEWVDRDGDGRITNLDRFVLGYSEPTTTGGLTNTLTYKGFRFSVLLDFAAGHTVLDNARSWLDGNKARRLATTTAVLSAWTKPGDAEITNQPRSDFHDQQHQNNLRSSDFYAYEADYISIRNVSISYNLGNKVLKDRLRKLEVYLTGNNLHYFTKHDIPNPERGGSIGHQQGQYPTFRMFTIGARIGI